MKIKVFITITICSLIVLSNTGCQKGDLSTNPNAASASAVLPLSLLVNNVTANFILPEEFPFGGNVYKYNQHQVSNYSKYWGDNTYGWSYSNDSYQILKYAIALENQAKSQLGTTNNKYFALAKFLRAYSAVWFSQKVGDIPMIQAGDPNNTTPAFDAQKTVYKTALALLDTANTIMTTINSVPANQNALFDGGDIFGLTNLQWQKLFNTYKLRVLISLSKRADDNADLNIKSQFAAIVTNPTTYPIMTGTSDNMVYKFTAANLYPPFAQGNNAYNNFQNVGETVLSITRSTSDPRTFLIAAPSKAGAYNSFSAFVGGVSSASLTDLQNQAATNSISAFNGQRYFGNGFVATTSVSTYEPFVFIGYSEMCFNIAEGINRGWAPSLSAADAATFYNNGISASFKNFGLNTASNSTITVSSVTGANLGSVTTDNATFLANVQYNVSDATVGLRQILSQKYVALFMNSGYEAFMNFRRTGIPSFSSNGPGTGTTSGNIPRRWLYPLSEINYNNANYLSAISSQFGGTDDVNKDTWLTK
ncbi:MAG: SusD/RagB family nutrient-binding outer membrane lipoprotein [Chitinophagia bacterium]